MSGAGNTQSPAASGAGNAGRAALTLWERLPPSGRAFIRFWGSAGLLLVLASVGLQEYARRHPPSSAAYVQPPGTQQQKQQAGSPPPAPGSTDQQANSAQAEPDRSNLLPPSGTRPIPGPIPSMLEPVADDIGHSLPRKGPNGELPRVMYAGAVPPVPNGNARIGILLEGFGLSEALSSLAIHDLPSMVSFAVPAYAPARKVLMDEARWTGHELFLSLPMQPSAAPLDDEGPKALGYDHPISLDRSNLDWALSRFAGYVGVTNGFSGQEGDAFAQSPDFRMVSEELDARGLLYLNATPGGTRVGPVVGGDASVVIDTDADAASIDDQLNRLADLAKLKGNAVAVAGPMRPVLIQRLSAWANQLATRGISLVPVSSLCDTDASASAQAQQPQQAHIQ